MSEATLSWRVCFAVSIQSSAIFTAFVTLFATRDTFCANSLFQLKFLIFISPSISSVPQTFERERIIVSAMSILQALIASSSVCVIFIVQSLLNVLLISNCCANSFPVIGERDISPIAQFIGRFIARFNWTSSSVSGFQVNVCVTKSYQNVSDSMFFVNASAAGFFSLN